MTERERLAALQELNLLDTSSEKDYDDLVRLASAICGTPISLVSLVDEDRQWFKAAFGLEAKQTPREVSFCSHAIQQPELFVVEDASKDHRFLSNSLVTGNPHIRFYAGMPLQAPGGEPIGTLCVIDRVPRKLNESQTEALIILASQVQARMKLRLQQKTLEAKQDALQGAFEENKRLCHELKATNDLFLCFMSHAPFASYIKDADGRMVFYNKYLAEINGVTEEEWLGRKDSEIWPAEVAAKFRTEDLAVLESGLSIQCDDMFPGPDGNTLFWKTFKFPYNMGNGRSKLAGMSIDVTADVIREAQLENALREKTRLAAQLEIQATTDFLTGLSTRRVFAKQAEAEFSEWKRRHSAMSVLIMDVDNFKKRNDLFGHSAGDEALVLIGRLLQKCVRTGDVVARMGGEEFGLLLPHTGLPEAMEVAERFRELLSQQPCGHFPLTVSIGAVSAHADAACWETLFSQADEVLYVAKRTGKNRCVAYGQTDVDAIFEQKAEMQVA